MLGILGVAMSSLSAYQRALDVTGNNIANANTPGYSRQTLSLTPRPTIRYGNSYIGSGVAVNSIQRYSDYFANQQVRDTLSVKSQYDIFYQQALEVDKLLSQDGTNISATLGNFFSSLNQLNDVPNSIPARNVALKQSELLVEQFNTLQLRVDEYKQNTHNQLSQTVAQVNQLSSNIADINKQLANAPESAELLDKRDELLRQLSEYGEITVVDQGNDGISVGIGNGAMLVLGTQKFDLSVASSVSEHADAKILLGNGAGKIDISQVLNSGKLGGLLDYEREILVPASQQLGKMAIGLADAFNKQHRLGMDMNNQIGKDFFTDYNQSILQSRRVSPSSANTGTAVLSVAISDVNQLELSDYEVEVTNAATNEVRITRLSDGQITTTNWTDTPPAPPAGQIAIDGITINADNLGNLADNDRFTLTPTQGAAGDLALNIKTPKEIAFAAPVRAESLLTNTGNGVIKLGEVFNTTDVNKEFRIEFISDTQYNIVNVTDTVTTGPFVFTPNADNTIMIPDGVTPSYSVVVSGIPKSGDVFTMEYNAGGFGDNRNGLLLSDIQTKKIFSGNAESLFEAYSSLITEVGSKTAQSQLRGDAADVLYKQAADFRESESGVNLDEEAANILRFEQAYQAAGKLMAVANQMMDVLFAAVG